MILCLCHLGLGAMECADVVCVGVFYVAIIGEAQHKTPIALWEHTIAHTP